MQKYGISLLAVLTALLPLLPACRQIAPPPPSAAIAAPDPSASSTPAAPLPRLLQSFNARLLVSERQIPAILKSAESAAQRFAQHPDTLVTVPYGDQSSFAEEILNRAGGLAIALPLEERPRHNRATPHDIFLFSVRSWEKDGARARRQLTQAASNGWLTVLFASKAGRPTDIPADLLIDNGASGPGDDEAALNAIANVLNVWLWQCEFVAACSRHGEVPGILQSIYFPEAVAHNGPIQKDRLIRLPCSNAVPQGVLAHLYLDRVHRLVEDLNRKPVRAQIETSVALIRARVAAGKTPAISTCTHFGMNEIAHNTRAPWKPFQAVWKASTAVTNTVHRGDLLVWISYIGISTPYEDYGRYMRESGADFITCFVPDSDPSKNAPDALAHIDQSWALGDAEVPIPFPPGRMAPVSGLNVGLIFRMLDEAVADPISSVSRK
jgi:hypothetical protein